MLLVLKSEHTHKRGTCTSLPVSPGNQLATVRPSVLSDSKDHFPLLVQLPPTPKILLISASLLFYPRKGKHFCLFDFEMFANLIVTALSLLQLSFSFSCKNCFE